MNTGETESQEDFLFFLPKTELHVHLEACVRPATLAALCARYREDDELQVYINMAKSAGYTDMQDFFTTWKRVNNLIRTYDDLALVTTEYLEDAARMNCMYVELNINILRQISKGLDPHRIVHAICSAQKAAEKNFGVVSRTLLSISRDWEEEDALMVVNLARQHKMDRVAGIDVSGNEKAKPNKHYRNVFKQAHDIQVMATAHAGENAGWQSVVSAVKEIGVARIGHGLDAAVDSGLIEMLKKMDIAVEICATSNYKLGHVASIDSHPGKNLLNSGVACTFNTDDPLLFGINIYDEYRCVAESWQLTTEQIVAASRNGIKYGFLDKEFKENLLQEFDTKIAKCKREFNLMTAWQPAFRTAVL